jgi:hypothetical protein
MGGCNIHEVAWTSNYDSESFCEQCLDPIVQKRLKQLKEGWEKANKEICRLGGHDWRDYRDGYTKSCNRCYEIKELSWLEKVRR